MNLYEAKYKFRMNKWWPADYPDYKAVIFNVATNDANINGVKKELVEISQLYCESKGGNFTFTEAYDRPAMTSSTKEYYLQLDRIIEARKTKPDLVCSVGGVVHFKGVVVAGAYKLESGMIGADMRVWAVEYKWEGLSINQER